MWCDISGIKIYYAKSVFANVLSEKGLLPPCHCLEEAALSCVTMSNIVVLLSPTGITQRLTLVQRM